MASWTQDPNIFYPPLIHDRHHTFNYSTFKQKYHSAFLHHGLVPRSNLSRTDNDSLYIKFSSLKQKHHSTFFHHWFWSTLERGHDEHRDHVTQLFDGDRVAVLLDCGAILITRHDVVQIHFRFAALSYNTIYEFRFMYYASILGRHIDQNQWIILIFGQFTLNIFT